MNTRAQLPTESPVRAGAKTRVGLFNEVLPHYRQGIFRLLASQPGQEWTFCMRSDLPGSFLKTMKEPTGFRFRNTYVYKMALPNKRNAISIQPYALASMLTGAYDVFVLSDDILSVSAWGSVLLSRILGRKVCLWGQGKSRPETRVRIALRKVLMSLAHAYVFYTEGVRDMWVRRGFPARKAFVAYNALDTEESAKVRQQVTAEDIQEFRQERGLIGKRGVLMIGRLLPSKKPDLLIRMMAQVTREVHDAHAIIIGDGPMQEELTGLVTELDLAKEVTLVGAVHEEAELAKYFAVSDVMVCPAGAGLAIQHAFAYGVPVVLGDDMISHGPEAELVKQEETGLYCPDGDVGAFASAVIRSLTDESLRSRMSGACEAAIAEKYNVHMMAKGFTEAIAYCVDPGRG